MLSNSHGILDLKLSSTSSPIISLWETAEDQPPAEREFFMTKKSWNFDILKSRFIFYLSFLLL